MAADAATNQPLGPLVSAVAWIATFPRELFSGPSLPLTLPRSYGRLVSCFSAGLFYPHSVPLDNVRRWPKEVPFTLVHCLLYLTFSWARFSLVLVHCNMEKR